MKAKKSLGQNFFTNRNLATSIVKNIFNTKYESVVEIGPGMGSFTQLLHSEEYKNLFLIEKDNLLAENLKNTYSKAKVFNEDFLDFDLSTLPQKNKTLFFGSLPYNVSKQIIRKILQSNIFNSECYFIIQKEVAEKYCSRIPNSNYLALETSIYGKVTKILDISPNSFKPKPKVISSLIKITPETKYHNLKSKEFRSFLKISFTQPRKTLRNNLKGIQFKEDEKVTNLLSKRPQHLSLDQISYLFSQVEAVLV